MRIAFWVLAGMIVLAIAAYWLLFPHDRFMILHGPGGGAITFGRASISYRPPPDRYSTNGFDHIESYVSRLLVPSPKSKFLSMFTPDGQRGFALSALDGRVEASLTVDLRKEAGREAAIQAFFKSMGVTSTEDYLAANGGVPDSTRGLQYLISGNTAEVTTLAKRILHELCAVSPSEALNIQYEEK